MSSLKLTLQSPRQIAYFLGHDNYCWLHFRTGEKKLLAKPLSYLEAQLPEFIRVHKTVLLNPHYIKSLREPTHYKKGGEVYLDSGEVFPVSRRRWPTVAERWQSLPVGASGHQEVAQEQLWPALPPMDNPPPAPSPLSIVWVSSDSQKAQRVEHVLEQHWSAYQLKALQPGVLLVDVLSQSAESDYPVLILIDAQTKTLDGLRLLRGLKANPQLRQIPLILFVPSSDPLIIEGYAEQANSVILLPNQYPLFNEVIRRVLHYWLGVVALPRYTED